MNRKSLVNYTHIKILFVSKFIGFFTYDFQTY